MPLGGPLAPGVAGAVLAGGASRRMGRDKALLAGPDHRPLLQRALDALRATGCDPLLVSAGAAAPYRALAASAGAKLVLDLRPGQGPLAGLEAVLLASSQPWTLVVACDMPTLEPRLLRALIARAASPAAGDQQALAVVPRAAGQPQPLHALYHRQALPHIQAALDADELGLIRALGRLQVDWVELEAGPSFTNVNEPADL